MITQERLKQLLRYDSETGVFVWLAKSAPNATRTNIGCAAGCVDGGYLKIKVDKTKYSAHRLAWLYVYGEFPSSVIDHLNRDKLDNRITNLKDSTVKGNNRNKPIQSNNKSGVNGVYYKSKIVNNKTYAYAVVQWKDIEGKVKDKSFNIDTYGYEEATNLAVAYRKSMELNLNSLGAGYADDHGGVKQVKLV